MANDAKDIEVQSKKEVETPEGVERLSPSKVYAPKVDIFETDGHIALVVDVPGCAENDIEIMIEKNVLTLRGNVDSQAPADHALAYGEYGIGNYERSFTLSDEIDSEKIEARLKDGVLQIRLPKAGPRTRKIAVSAD